MATAGNHRGAGPERAFHPELAADRTVTLSDEESAHLVRVRRVAAGEPVVCFDGEGGSYLGTLTRADPRAAQVTLQAPYPSREPPVRVLVAASIPEPSRADAMVAALAELGVYRWTPLLCARIPPKRADLVARRRARWARAAREAAKVNGRATVMTIGAGVSLGAVLEAGGWVLDPDPAAPLLGAALSAAPPAAQIQVLIGPEGGFTDDEIALAREAGVRPASLGACVLRTATAAVAAAAICLAYDTHRGDV